MPAVSKNSLDKILKQHTIQENLRRIILKNIENITAKYNNSLVETRIHQKLFPEKLKLVPKIIAEKFKFLFT